ncbi:MAG: thioredoxin family protein [Bacilli bacterium]|nr:thioredoxin family protein [Bacilli bacterium]
MKLLKIGAIWCGGCLVMNNVIQKALKEYSFEYEELDLDMDEDEVKKYNPGDKLPVFIVLDNNKEVSRFVGEYKYDDFIKKLKELEVINEKEC